MEEQTKVTLLLLGGNSFSVEHNFRIAQLFSELFSIQLGLFTMTPFGTTENPSLGVPYSTDVVACFGRLYQRALRHARRTKTSLWLLAFSAGLLFASDVLRALSPSDLPDYLISVAGCFSLGHFLPLVNPPWFRAPFEPVRDLAEVLQKSQRQHPWIWVVHSQSDDFFPRIERFLLRWPEDQFIRVRLGVTANQLSHLECCWEEEALTQLFIGLRNEMLLLNLLKKTPFQADNNISNVGVKPRQLQRERGRSSS